MGKEKLTDARHGRLELIWTGNRRLLISTFSAFRCLSKWSDMHILSRFMEWEKKNSFPTAVGGWIGPESKDSIFRRSLLCTSPENDIIPGIIVLASFHSGNLFPMHERRQNGYCNLYSNICRIPWVCAIATLSNLAYMTRTILYIVNFK